ncbi:MAG TPA: BlaI/MecI/CopY family transcriptional regulator [Planctomycetaceae bacterium]|jgi:predicted transcriptional regulator|nr:BlaI/MecI/CopY family transcriptional regulator [Planctomycetaceae bacterium]
MNAALTPTERELEILKILWDRGEASVRDVYEQMRQTTPIVQNTVQAFLRTMEDKGLVRHRVEGRSFIYKPVVPRAQTTKQLTTEFVEHVFDGAIDQLVETAFSHRTPSEAELTRLEELVAEVRAARGKQPRSERRRT